MCRNLTPLWKYIISSVLLLVCISANAQLSITPNRTAVQLANTLSGKGVTVLNADLNCATAANATFASNNTNIGLDSGVILTSGTAAGLSGPQSQLASLNNGSAGDPDLSNLSGQNTLDACILEFDFIPKGDSIKFDYVFSSEEYINATCGPYNDVFGFFISGNGITGQKNLALVPYTVIPVAINSINNGVPGSGFSLSNCQVMGPGSPFTQYYIDNTAGTTVTHKGFTTVLQANYAVVPCSTYHLKLAIADAGNALYDSGVFLKAGSLQTNILTALAVGAVPQQDTMVTTPFIVKGCAPGSFVINAQPLPVARVVQIAWSGSAVSGTDYSPLPVSVTIPANQTSFTIPVNALPTPAAGTKDLTLSIIDPFACDINNQVADSATILIYDSVNTYVTTTDTTICRFQSVPLQVAGNSEQQYQWFPLEGLDNGLTRQPVASPLETTTYIVTVNWPGSGCSAIRDSVTIQVLPVPFIDLDTAMNVCIDGVLTLDPVLRPDSSGYLYQWSGPGGFTANILQASVSDITDAGSGIYLLTVTVNNGCPQQKDSIKVNVVSPPPPASVKSPYYFCAATVESHLHDPGDSLMWYTERNNNIGTPLIPLNNNSPEGLYVYYVAQVDRGCVGDRIRTLVHVDRCCEDNMFIPDAFTPNNDGRNDQLTFTRSDDHHLKAVKIFNRWGECVFQSTEPSPAWDGTYKGQLADVGYYYYIVTMACNSGTEITENGEVILLR